MRLKNGNWFSQTLFKISQTLFKNAVWRSLLVARFACSPWLPLSLKVNKAMVEAQETTAKGYREEQPVVIAALLPTSRPMEALRSKVAVGAT
jgi:hypothetical protein